MPANLETIVQRMIDAGEDEPAIASVIQHYRQGERSTPGAVGPATVGAANAGRAVAGRAGMQVATSPNLSRAVKAGSGPLAQHAARAVGSTGGIVGYAVGEAATNPSVRGAVEAGIRGGSRVAAKVAGSSVARAVTGVPGMLASMPVSEAGDRPAGETPERTSNRQTSFAHQFKDQVNREAGRQVITGTTKDEILESIARYRGSR